MKKKKKKEKLWTSQHALGDIVHQSYDYDFTDPLTIVKWKLTDLILFALPWQLTLR